MAADAAAAPPPRPPSARLPPLRRLRSAACAVALILAAACAPAAELHGYVIAIADGDTLTVLDHARTPHKVRIAGIDAPEVRQPYGLLAREHLASRVFRKPVVVVWHKHDRYGRLVGHLHLVVPGECGRPECARREDIGLAQIESGLAWHYKRFQNEQTPEERRLYAIAEETARSRRAGLWGDLRPVPPWEFRTGRREG